MKNRLSRERVILEGDDNVEVSQDFPPSQQTDVPALKVVKATSRPPQRLRYVALCTVFTMAMVQQC